MGGSLKRQLWTLERATFLRPFSLSLCRVVSRIFRPSYRETEEFAHELLIRESVKAQTRRPGLSLSRIFVARREIISSPILSSSTSSLNQFDPDNEHVPLYVART